ncbi:hypothetical protein GGI25_001597 [Coemansia spiralis]|uniref:SYO1-like TPR repeats domain-containing protein n=2 Tax=Coemansia TaxID=4863 RepID=A0A9W8GAI7_9FUNG|nr:hypothetical protein EDC05_003377 [Coemansia umbellata]KAJ2623972.1 hypothetical protein GGI26_001987 [Coemansia sp. RSA 1358]KAJ2679241.1 hypothetical protein GGI25_001597 [Coemansia spiralis]
MGRIQKRTFKEQRYNPLGTSTIQGAATTVQSKEEVPALIKKLGSSDANDRVWAAASASNLLVSDDPSTRRLLLANNVVSALIERLSDSVPEVVVQVTGALHNIAAIDQGAAEEISRRNIYAAIQNLIPRLAKSIDDIIKQKDEKKQINGDERKLVFLTTDNLISILWVLCETVPSSLRQINDMALSPFLVSFFSVADKLPSSLVQTAGQFLFTLTDDNFHAKRALLSHPSAVGILMNAAHIKQSDISLSADDLAIIRILAGGILANVKPTALSMLEKQYKHNSDGIPADVIKPWDDLSKALLQVISQFIEFDVHVAAIQAASSIKTNIGLRAESVSNGAESIANGSDNEIALGQLSSRISYVQMALELAANIFTDEGASDADAAVGENIKDKNLRDEEEPVSSDDDNNDGNSDGNDENDDDADYSDIVDEEEDVEDKDNTGFDQDDMDDVLADEDTIAKKADEAVQNSILGVFINSIIPSLQRLAEPTKMTTLATALNECSVLVNGDGDSGSSSLVASVVEDFAALNERALGCFNNFLLVIEESIKSWFLLHKNSVDHWWRFLIAIAEHIFGVDAAPEELSKLDQRLRFSVLEPAFGCMWTLARGVGGSVPVTPEHIKGFIHICGTAPNVEIRAKIVGVLGNIARRQPGHIEENQHIGLYLLEQVISKPLLAFSGSSGNSMTDDDDDDISVEPIVEAMDMLFDIYSDMAFDYDEPVFVRGDFLNKLRQLYIPMRKLAKTIDRRRNKELRDRSDLVVQNLRAFIEYKASERKI